MANQSSSAGRSSNLLRRLLCCINPPRHSASQQLPSTSPDHEQSNDEQSNGLINTLEIEEEDLLCMAAAGQDGLLYTGRSSGTIQSFNKGQEEVGFNNHHSAVKDIIIDAQSRIISCHDDLDIDVTMRSDAQPPLHQAVRTLPSLYMDMDRGHRWPIVSLCLSDDSRFLFSGDEGGCVCVWNLNDGGLIERLGHSYKKVTAITTGTGGLMFTSTFDGRIGVYQRVAGADGDDRPPHEHLQTLNERITVYSLLFKDTEGGGGLYVGLWDGTLKFFEQSPNWRRRPVGAVFGTHGTVVTHIAGSTGPLVCSGSRDGVIFIWRQEQGSSHTCIKELMTNQNPLRGLAVQDDWEDNNEGPRRSILYTGSRSNIKIWRIDNMA